MATTNDGAAGRAQRMAFGPTHNGTGEIEVCRANEFLAGYDELRRRVERSLKSSIKQLERVDHVGCNLRLTLDKFVAVVRVRGEFGHEHVQIAFEPNEQFVEFCMSIGASVGPRDAEHRLRFVDGAVPRGSSLSFATRPP